VVFTGRSQEGILEEYKKQGTKYDKNRKLKRMPRLLYDDRLAPITSTLGFLECDTETAASAFCRWRERILRPYGQTIEARDVSSETLEGTLRHLLPLANMHLKFLFVPTRSRWTAYFDNGWHGSDPVSIVSYLAQEIGCLGVRAVWVPNTKAGRRGRYGGVIFTVYDRPNPILNVRRSVGLVNDGNWTAKWDFDTSGEPFPFEQTERYKARRKTDRFTPEMLDAYLKELGIDAFSEDFYVATKDNPAKLVLIGGKIPPSVKEYSLEEARSDY
jgi:hypothetical protein